MSKTRGISTSFSSERGAREGEGDNTTEGIRLWPCLDFESLDSGMRVIVTGAVSVLFSSGFDVAVGSHWKPGFTIKFTVSPSLTSYSFNNLASARALPFSSSLWTSVGGAPGSAASCDLMDCMVSVGCTERE